tara:strand:- start:94 stop:1527 length:1434 start_codon:yes stop_codon:yes gene_type:complete
MNEVNYIAAAPEITLLGLICFVLIADLFIDDDNRIRTFWISLIALTITTLVIIISATDGRTLTFNDSYVSDHLSKVLKLSAVIFVGIAFTYSRNYLRVHEIHKGEFYLLGLIGLLGMMIMISSNSMLIMYLGLETLSLSMYTLVAIDRNNVTSAESAMKYFILGAIASGCLLYGISWIYGVTGSLNFNEISLNISSNPALNSLPLWFGLSFLIVGIGFKFGAVPFHMWLPDVYQGSRTPVTLYLATAPKFAAIALFLRFLVDGLGSLHDTWMTMIMVIAVLSLLVGNFVAIAQKNIKRMLGYSTIAQVGFILLALLTGTEQGYSVAIFYTLTYVLAASGAFGMIILLSRRGYEAENLSDFKGLNSRNPWFALMMLFLMFSMAGVPPFVGFFAKLNVINIVIDSGLISLAVLMVLASVVGAFYYLRIIWYMYFEENEDKTVLQASLDARLMLSLNALAVLAIGIAPGWLLTYCYSIFN